MDYLLIVIIVVIIMIVKDVSKKVAIILLIITGGFIVWKYLPLVTGESILESLKYHLSFLQ